MKVFISWSGELSKKVAELLNEWIPNVIQSAEPWISSEDIAKGEIWFSSVTDALANTGLGIICLTGRNLEAPWILFEAGALSKGLTKNRVCTFLVDIKPKDLKAPLSQFNATMPTKEDVAKLLQVINASDKENHLPDDRIQKAFERWWPDFEKKFGDVVMDQDVSEIDVTRPAEEMTDEILETVRSIHNMMQEQKNTEESQNLQARLFGNMMPHYDPIAWASYVSPFAAYPSGKPPDVFAQLVAEAQRENIRVWSGLAKADGHMEICVSQMPSDPLKKSMDAIAVAHGKKGLSFSVNESGAVPLPPAQ